MKKIFNRKSVAPYCAVIFPILFIISTPSSAYDGQAVRFPFVWTYELG